MKTKMTETMPKECTTKVMGRGSTPRAEEELLDRQKSMEGNKSKLCKEAPESLILDLQDDSSARDCRAMASISKTHDLNGKMVNQIAHKHESIKMHLLWTGESGSTVFVLKIEATIARISTEASLPKIAHKHGCIRKRMSNGGRILALEAKFCFRNCCRTTNLTERTSKKGSQNNKHGFIRKRIF